MFLIVVFTGSVKYLQYKEKRRLELKQKVFTSSFKGFGDDDETFERDEEGDEDEDNEEDQDAKDKRLE